MLSVSPAAMDNASFLIILRAKLIKSREVKKQIGKKRE
jgi:hypothetical protein